MQPKKGKKAKINSAVSNAARSAITYQWEVIITHYNEIHSRYRSKFWVQKHSLVLWVIRNTGPSIQQTVSVPEWLMCGGWLTGIWFWEEKLNIYFVITSRSVVGVTKENGGSCTGVKRQEHEPDYSPLSTVKVNTRFHVVPVTHRSHLYCNFI
jgi:hypothetical protein